MSAFTQTIQRDSITAFERNRKGLQAAYVNKDSNTCKENYKICLEGSMEVHVLYKEFTERSAAASEIVRYLETLLKLVNILKSLISADREGNWKGHLQAIQNMIPVFCQGGSVNYQRYCSLYLEMMRHLPEEHPSIHKEFMEGKFIVKTSAGFFKGVAPDMKLVQSIQRSKKGAGGIIGQTKQNTFVTEWELAYHEVLDIRKSYSNITRSILAETDATTLNKKLRSKNMNEYYEAVKQAVDFLNKRSNPYKVVGSVKLHHFISKQVVPGDNSDCILSVFGKWEQNLLEISGRAFPEKRKEAC